MKLSQLTIIGPGREQKETGKAGLYSYKAKTSYDFKTLVYNCPKDLKEGTIIETQMFNGHMSNSSCGLVYNHEFVSIVKK